MDDFEFEESTYIGENLKEILKEIAHRARITMDDIQDDVFNYDYIDNLTYSVISGIIQLSFFIMFKKLYEKGYLK